MNFQDIEKFRLELLATLPVLYGKAKLFKISSFYSILLSTNDKNTIEAYSLDFIQDYIAELHNFSPFYQSPQKTELLLKQLNDLKSISTIKQFEKEFGDLIYTISNSINDLKDVLDNKRNNSLVKNLSFPLIESLQDSTDEETFGTIESVCIKINHAKKQNKFVFVPSDKKVEERLLNQSKISFDLALNYFQNKKHTFHKYHEILIYFENLSASYLGESLGVALTVGFIEQLSILYNLPYLTHIKNNIATTGGVDPAGIILPVSKEIIEKKIEIVFYSDIDSFVIPKEDEIHARQKFKKLQILYPNRKLNLIAIENINDLTNRRDLVDIKKQSHVLRLTKGIRKNWIASTLIFLLILMSVFFYVRELDKNPYMFELNANEILIKNKSGLNLWNIKSTNRFELPHGTSEIESYLRILDVNDDGANEVLYHFDLNSSYSDTLITTGLVLFDSKGNILSRYSFKKMLSSRREYLTPPYSIELFDTLRVNGDLCILCGSNNRNSYASAAYIFNLRTKKIISDTLWNPGHINDIRIADLDNNEKKELLFLTCNNGYKKTSLYHINLDELKGQAQTTDEYRLYNVRDAKTLHYFLLPNSDYNQYLNLGYNSVRKRGLSFDHESKKIRFIVFEAGLNKSESIIYNWDYMNNDFILAISNGFQLSRDKIVKNGALNLPYTDTKEYCNLVKDQILFYNGNSFVKRNEIK